MDWLYSREIPIEAQYLYRKARELAKLEKNEAALRYFKQAAVIAPRYSKAIYEMGNCLANLGRYDEAIEKYNRAIKIDPFAADAEIKRDMAVHNRELNKSVTTGNKFTG